MADISQELQAIMQAIYGEEVRGSIHDAIKKINDVSEVVLSVGTAVTSASSPVTGFFEDSLYINSNTYDLWQCTGTAWALKGNLEGATIASVTKIDTQGLVDTYQINLTNGESGGTFTVTNGRDATGSTIASLDDVLLTSLADKQILKYDGTAQKWKNVDETVSGLKDTNISTPTDRQIMEYDSTSQKWKNSSALAKTEEMIAPVETSPSTRFHSTGEQIIYNDVLYDVINNIDIDDPLTTTGVSPNIAVADTLTEQIASINSDISSLTAGKADKSDITNISIIGTYNTESYTIYAGGFFYWNGTLVEATKNIASGATITLGTNCRNASGLSGAVNDLADRHSLSGTERLVGTWFGRPMYEKVLVNQTATSGTADLLVGEIQNCRTIFILSGYYINQNAIFGDVGSCFMITNTGRNSETTAYTSYAYAIVATGNVGKVYVLYGSNTASSETGIIVRYTKTTD